MVIHIPLLLNKLIHTFLRTRYKDLKGSQGSAIHFHSCFSFDILFVGNRACHTIKKKEHDISKHCNKVVCFNFL